MVSIKLSDEAHQVLKIMEGQTGIVGYTDIVNALLKYSLVNTSLLPTPANVPKRGISKIRTAHWIKEYVKSSGIQNISWVLDKILGYQMIEPHCAEGEVAWNRKLVDIFACRSIHYSSVTTSSTIGSSPEEQPDTISFSTAKNSRLDKTSNYLYLIGERDLDSTSPSAIINYLIVRYAIGQKDALPPVIWDRAQRFMTSEELDRVEKEKYLFTPILQRSHLLERGLSKLQGK